MSDLENKIHLYHRAGFGISLDEFQKIESKSVNDLVTEIFNNSGNPQLLKPDLETANFNKKLKDLSDAEKKELQKKAREENMAINVLWLNKMSATNEFLNEKMTLFWHNHFACKSRFPKYNLNQNNLIRKYALGNFRDFVHAIAKDASMLAFLNNIQNKKDAPNENFARELMELFTIGKGNYTEEDIKNAAKAFTGWSIEESGEFILRKRQHDSGSKKFFGKTGNFEGEDIINILLDDRRTSEFITRKIIKAFVNPNPDSDYVKEYSKYFFESGYDIKKLMNKIFSGSEFYESKNINSQIKSPVELLAGLMKTFNITFSSNKSPLAVQKILGQILLNPPNVAGWKGGKNWIDSSSLLFRMNLTEYFFKSSEIELNYKDELEDNAQTKKILKQLDAEINLKPMVNYFSKFENEELQNKLSYYILGSVPESKNLELAIQYSDNSTANKYIESLALKLTSLPEFQLC